MITLIANIMWEKYIPSTGDSLSRRVLNDIHVWIVGEKRRAVLGDSTHITQQGNRFETTKCRDRAEKDDSNLDLMMFPVL